MSWTNGRDTVIVDTFYPEGAAEGPSIYLRMRSKAGNVVERIIAPGHQDYVRPFCWIPAASRERRLRKLRLQFPSAVVHPTERATALDGTELMKVSFDNPTDLWELKNARGIPPTYEADLNYSDQILFTLYPDGLPEFHPRVWHFDLEWNTDRDNPFTTVMAVADSHSDENVVFAWRPNITTPRERYVDREGGYILFEFGSEADMHDAFLMHMEECDPDILVAHAIMWADLPHMMSRMDEPERLSPLGKVFKPFKDGGYKDTQQPIKGRLCWDSAAHWKSGSGFETLWQKSGRGQVPNRKLATFAELLDLGSKLTDEIEGMTVHNGWREYYDDFVDYCLRDTTLLADISERLNAIEFFVAMQQLCGVQWSSTHNVSRYIRGLISRRTDLKAPSAKYVQREHMQAAHIPDPVVGRHEGVACVDYASLYPNIIRSDNLCPTTKRAGPGVGIKTLGNGTHWDQQTKGVLPSIVEEMLELRAEYKRKMREAKTDEERLGFNMLQMAAKVSVNACYGYMGMKAVQGMWVDNDVASSITFRGREAIRHLMSESEEMGYRSLFGHTDSAFIQVPFDEAQALADHLTKTAQEKLSLPYMDVELEAYFDYWTTAPVKNRYFGFKTWPESEAGQLKVSGYELKASSSSAITKRVQRTAMDMVGHGASEEEVTEALRAISLAVKAGHVSIHDVIASTRLTKEPDDYESPTPAAKAALYFNQHNEGEPWRKGDSVPWTYVSGFKGDAPDYFTLKGERRRATYIAFREETELRRYHVNWEKVLDVMVKSKLKNIYDSLGWDLNVAAGAPAPTNYW